jgi:hypothetical protein
VVLEGMLLACWLVLQTDVMAVEFEAQSEKYRLEHGGVGITKRWGNYCRISNLGETGKLYCYKLNRIVILNYRSIMGIMKYHFYQRKSGLLSVAPTNRTASL